MNTLPQRKQGEVYHIESYGTAVSSVLDGEGISGVVFGTGRVFSGVVLSRGISELRRLLSFNSSHPARIIDASTKPRMSLRFIFTFPPIRIAWNDFLTHLVGRKCIANMLRLSRALVNL